MGLQFLKRVQRATAVVGAISFLVVSLYYDPAFGLGILVGTLWGIANLWALTGVLTAVFTPVHVDRRRAFVFAAVKLPFLYGFGILALRSDWFPPVSLVIGFSLLFFVILCKALGRKFLHLDDRVPVGRIKHST